ncbi:MAG: hypothetical protein AAFW68_00295 [Pseudomonadota bacterium]
MRVWGFLAVIAFCCAFALAAPFSPNNPAPDLRIAITQQEEATLRVVYEWRRPQREIMFAAIDGGYRARRWSFATPGFVLKRFDDGDYIMREDGKRFSRIELSARPELNRLSKEYQPVVRYGEGGALLYTGHFWPMMEEGGRVDAVFDFTPVGDGHVVAFGANEPAVKAWRSPMAHPAFVYLGPLEPVETKDVMALVDPDAPGWVVEEFNTIVPDSFAKLSDLFGFAPATKPNLFLSAPIGDEAGRLSYSGDALPAQFQITLEGAAWNEPSGKARRVFRHSTIHEAVHLWQAAARPVIEDAPEWIHEGAADAIASEVMVALGLWDAGALMATERAAQMECARGLHGGSLNAAKSRGAFRALYACGHVIAAAVAQAEGNSTAAFWRDFIARSVAADGYDADLFYRTIAERTDDQGFADAIEDFARTPLADPARTIDQLFAEAQTLARERGR